VLFDAGAENAIGVGDDASCGEPAALPPKTKLTPITAIEVTRTDHPQNTNRCARFLALRPNRWLTPDRNGQVFDSGVPTDRHLTFLRNPSNDAASEATSGSATRKSPGGPRSPSVVEPGLWPARGPSTPAEFGGDVREDAFDDVRVVLDSKLVRHRQ